MVVLAGHTRLAAAQQLGLKTAPVHVAKGLSESQARAFRIMDNRSAENAEWADDLLGLELSDLLEADYDLGLTGFTDEELNKLMSGLDDETGTEGEDDVPETPEDPVSRPGDLWVLGDRLGSKGARQMPLAMPVAIPGFGFAPAVISATARKLVQFLLENGLNRGTNVQTQPILNRIIADLIGQ